LVPVRETDLNNDKETPSRCIGVINGRVDIAKIDFELKTINLNKVGNEDEGQDFAKMRIH
jgi:hypothetical protein